MYDSPTIAIVLGIIWAAAAIMLAVLFGVLP